MASPIALTTPLPAGAFIFKRLSGRESISGLFSFGLDLLADPATPVPFDQLVGQRFNVSVAVPGGTQPRFFDGICSRFLQGKRGSLTEFTAELVPQLWRFTRKRNSRIFQQMTVPDILRRVLTGMTPSPLYQLGATYPVRNYCVQYRETDFDFASRLMEEEGIFYFFSHTATGHTMILADSPKSHSTVKGPNPATFLTNPPPHGESRDVMTWKKEQDLRSGKVTLRDHHFEVPGNHFEASASITDAVQVGAVTHHLQVGGNDGFELYEFPGGYAERFDGIGPGGADQPAELAKIQPDAARTAGIHMQREALESLGVNGTSNCRHFTAGQRFSLQGHFNGDGQYALTDVTHTATMTGDLGKPSEDTFDYHNSFQCIPIALPFRPARVTAAPTIPGLQSAIVVGPAGETEFQDKYGRVKVQFHWDRQGKNDEKSSCWVRVASLHAGQEAGFVAIPKIGDEVLVAFLEGDPDQPIIVGSAYNPNRMPQ
jgi:type VI secretion system secreted protein VgrG